MSSPASLLIPSALTLANTSERNSFIIQTRIWPPLSYRLQEFDGEAALFSYPAEDNKDVLRLEKKQKLFLFETCPILH